VAYLVLEKGKSSLLLRQLSGGNTVRIVGPDEKAFYGGVRFSADGTAIYFSKQEHAAGLDTTYRVPTLGGVPQKILDRAWSVLPSPDGAFVAFTRHETSSSPHQDHLLVARADGGGERKVAEQKEPGGLCCLSWSPESTRILYAQSSPSSPNSTRIAEVNLGSGEKKETRQTWAGVGAIAFLDPTSVLVTAARTFAEPYQIWEIKYPDGVIRRLTNDIHDYLGVRLPADRSRILTLQDQTLSRLWSVQGERATELTAGTGAHLHPRTALNGWIVYTASIGGRNELRVRSPSGEEQQIGQAGEHYDFSPDLTPDGTAVVFGSNRDGNFNIWKAPLDGSAPVRLTNHKFAYEPECTPDGKWVIYVNDDAGRPTLWKIPFAGGPPTQLSRKQLYSPAVSPDGRLIAAHFWDEKPESRRKIGILPIDGSESIRLIDFPPTARSLRWSPEGKAVTYVDTRQGVSNVWAQPIGGGAPRRLTSLTDKEIYSFDWMADGKTLICSRGETVRDLYLLTPETR
jgi:Tol biopolymer transport system component